MGRALQSLLAASFCLGAMGQAALQPEPPRRPGLEEVRRAMGIPSTDQVRGQQDIVGFASRADQMAKVWELSALPPAREALDARIGLNPWNPAGLFPTRAQPGVLGAICPHDDYIYAGRVYRQVLPLVTAKTVVLVGVFHKYRKFAMKDALVFDPYRAWRSPDGEIQVSNLRQELLAKLPAADFVQDAAMHDSEHSLEALAYWLKHARRDLEILPILVPSMSFERMEEVSARLGTLLAASAKARGWSLGKDFAIVVSSDGVHYGKDFQYTPYGEGGMSAYSKAYAKERDILLNLGGPLSAKTARHFYSTCVNPDKADEYRHTWCGRFSVPFGLLLLSETAKGLDMRTPPIGLPLAMGTSVDVPELPVRALGMGATAPANLYHFVGYPGVAFVQDPK